MRIVRKYKNSTNTLGMFVNVVMRKFDKARKLQKKRKYVCVIVSAKQQFRRKNGVSVRFQKNRGVVFTDRSCEKLVGTRAHGPAGREVLNARLETALFKKIASNCVVV